MKDIYIYIHICCINNWKEIINNILQKIKKTGLYDIIKEIRCVVLGNIDISQESLFKDDKIKVIYYSNNINLYERKILSLLYEDSQKEDFYVLYLHSKGVKYDGKYESITDWVNYLLYFNINYYEFIIKELKNHNTIGVNLTRRKPYHYSGNFWWSKSEYIKTLNPHIDSNYLSPEFWITQKLIDEPKKFLSLWKSSGNHYFVKYPEKKYINKKLKLYYIL